MSRPSMGAPRPLGKGRTKRQGWHEAIPVAARGRYDLTAMWLELGAAPPPDRVLRPDAWPRLSLFRRKAKR